jgi:NAD(P)-dependent dehydrogenase (short-subunit alcohol dehydrogenase family)
MVGRRPTTSSPSSPRSERSTMSQNQLFSLAGKRALVTGASRGIGRAIAAQMAAAGADVVVSSNEQGVPEQVADQLAAPGRRTLGLYCDIEHAADIDRLADRVLADWGGLDILVCNAGANLHEGALTEIPDDALHRMMRINVESTLQLCRRFLPGMAERRDGVILVTSSISGLRGNKRIGGYGISKAANAQLVRNLAVEWGPSNIRVNAISPGLIATEFAKPILEDEDYLPVRLAKTPLRRTGTPDEVAGISVCLASPAGAFVTGQNIVVDGGTLISD